MIEIFATVLSAFVSIFSLCTECGLPKKASYACNLKDNLSDLQKAFITLIDAKNEVMNRVSEAGEEHRQRQFNVELWLKNVEEVETKFADVQNVECQETQRLCLGGCCSTNLRKTYAFGKRVAKLLREVKKLNNQAEDFKTVVEPKSDATTSKGQAAGDLKHEAAPAGDLKHKAAPAGDLKHKAAPAKVAGAKALVEIQIERAQNISMDGASLNNNTITITQH